MQTDHFFKKRLERWSERKHRILTKYLTPFIAKVGSWGEREVYCIDGFAGAASYGKGEPGTPILFAQFSEVCGQWNNPVALKSINVEAKVKYFRELCKATESWVKRGVVTNKRGKFNRRADEILVEIGDKPALFFLDPFGPTGIDFATLVKIMNRPVKATEMLINFNVAGLRRIADGIRSRAGSDERAIQKKVQHVSNILGDSEWLSVLGQTAESKEREKYLFFKYSNLIKSHGYHVFSYPIREKLRSKPHYQLMFCSRHLDGVMLMNNFVREEEDLLFKEDVDESLPLFTAEPSELAAAVDKRRNHLEILVSDFAREKRRTNRAQIKISLIQSHFGQFHERDFTWTVNKLVDYGTLKADDGRKRINDNISLTFFETRLRGG